jgi:hypothetical protein
MNNKENIDGALLSRPYIYLFEDSENADLKWVVPVSSQYEKFKREYDKNVGKYGFCNFIRFGYVVGRLASFLIQNICPVTEKYISEIYVDKNNTPIAINEKTYRDVLKNARTVMHKVKHGTKLVWVDIAVIKNALLLELKENNVRESVKHD